MTPAIEILKAARVAHTVHEFEHDDACESYGVEVAQKLGLPPQRVFKTLLVQLDDHSLAVAVLPVCAMLSMKLIAKALESRKVAMADKGDVQKTTGYVPGGVSPLGQKKRLRSVIDASAWEWDTIFISAGRRGLQVALAPSDLQRLTGASLDEICQLP